MALQGTLFHDRMKPDVVRKIKRELVNLEEAYLEKHPGANINRVWHSAEKAGCTDSGSLLRTLSFFLVTAAKV